MQFYAVNYQRENKHESYAELFNRDLPGKDILHILSIGHSLITFKHLSHFSMQTFIRKVVNHVGWKYVKFSLRDIIGVKFDLIAL